jgi:hypothetical protein
LRVSNRQHRRSQAATPPQSEQRKLEREVERLSRDNERLRHRAKNKNGQAIPVLLMICTPRQVQMSLKMTF